MLRSLSGSLKDVNKSSVILLTVFLTVPSNLGDSFISTFMDVPFRVFDPVMEYANKYRNEAFLYGMKIFECELALVKLAIEKYFLDDLLDVRLYPFWGGVIKDSRRSLN